MQHLCFYVMYVHILRYFKQIKNTFMIHENIKYLQMYGSRCTQLLLIEELPQWLSGPSSSLSVATDRPRVRTRSIYSTISIDDINAKAVEA
jgi:hypothetical protein